MTKTAEVIIGIVREYHDNYAAQDNIEAARVTRVLRRLLEDIQEPDFEALRRKFLGP